jgi:hypothetical protein
MRSSSLSFFSFESTNSCKISFTFGSSNNASNLRKPSINASFNRPSRYESSCFIKSGK